MVILFIWKGFTVSMIIRYKNVHIERICTVESIAKKNFDHVRYVEKLMSLISLIEQSPTLSDLIAFQNTHFHATDFYVKNSYGLDIAGRKSMYRLIIVPLDDDGNEIVRDDTFFDRCKQIKILRIEEVSKHYE